ncbi:MAG: hypothetical protein KDI60_09270, partial [Xanthomonadales bacterium]|nr:hypothetical protein [Xanthomonadales bacterium]
MKINAPAQSNRPVQPLMTYLLTPRPRGASNNALAAVTAGERVRLTLPYFLAAGFFGAAFLAGAAAFAAGFLAAAALAAGFFAAGAFAADLAGAAFVAGAAF